MLHIASHPQVAADLTILRDRSSTSDAFRRALRRVSLHLAFEATSQLSLRKLRVETPLEETDGWVLDRPVVLIPILRAGLGMVDAFLEIIPGARVGHVGLYRNEETLEPVEYYTKYPSALAQSEVFILDPMLATGGSAAAAASMLKKIGATKIQLVTLVAAPEGVSRIQTAYPDMKIYTAGLDRGLNGSGYIVPGLGDAGDRIFGTFADTA